LAIEQQYIRANSTKFVGIEFRLLGS